MLTSRKAYELKDEIRSEIAQLQFGIRHKIEVNERTLGILYDRIAKKIDQYTEPSEEGEG